MKHVTHTTTIAAFTMAILIAVYSMGGMLAGGTQEAYAAPPIVFHDAAAPMVLDAGMPVAVDAGVGGAGGSVGAAGSATPTPAPVPTVDPAALNPDSIDTTSEASGFLGFLTTGKWLPAIGCALMLIVWGARSFLAARWAFFKTKAGGYVLGFGIPFLLYLGTALQAGAGLSLMLVGHALGAILVAAGGWEHLGDLVSKFQPKAVTDAKAAA
jgi:hypothetical protein